MRACKRSRLKLLVERLEDRLTPSGATPFPIVPPVNQSLSLLSTYGQYQEQGGLHMHESIDIIARAGTPVYAVEDGTVRGVSAVGAAAPDGFLAVESGDHGWNYYHMTPGLNPATGLRWAVGDNFVAVNRGVRLQLGVVEAFPPGFGTPDHLHLDYGDKAADPRYGPLRRPIADPLFTLASLNDRVAPTVSDDIHFRSAASDTNGRILANAATGQLAVEEVTRGHAYFFEVDAGNRLVIGEQAPMRDADGNNTAGTSDVDIVASMHDKLLNGGDQVGVKDVFFQATGQKWGGDTGRVNSFYFGGQYLNLAGPPAGHNYNAFRDLTLTRTVYENDSQSNSAQGGPYWYTVTNNDGNLTVSATDRARYWNTDVEAGQDWNNPNRNMARNADARFADDFYAVRVTARDEALNEGANSRTVLLDNYVQSVDTTKNVYKANEDVVVSGGAQYRANQRLSLYVVTAQPADGGALRAGDVQANVTTTARGEVPQRNLGKYAPGTYWVVADYNQDGVYQPRLDGLKQFRVEKADAGVGVNSSVNPSIRGRNVTFTATVSGLPDGGPPPITGAVEFVIDGGNPIRVNLNGSAQATYATADLTVGVHTVVANYLGDASYNAGSGNYLQVVLPKITFLDLFSSLNPSRIGQAVTLTADVGVEAPDGGTPTGTVSFYDDGNFLGLGSLDGSGVATITTSSLPVGSHEITAEYGGDADFEGSSGSLTQVVDANQTSTTLVSSLNPSYFGDAVTFTATVSPVGTAPDDTPTGVVDFYDDGSYLGGSSLSGGVATFTTSSLAVGLHGITAVYSGDGDLWEGSSAALTQEVLGDGDDPDPIIIDPIDPVIIIDPTDPVIIIDPTDPIIDPINTRPQDLLVTGADLMRTSPVDPSLAMAGPGGVISFLAPPDMGRVGDDLFGDFAASPVDTGRDGTVVVIDAPYPDLVDPGVAAGPGGDKEDDRLDTVGDKMLLVGGEPGTTSEPEGDEGEWLNTLDEAVELVVAEDVDPLSALMG